VQTLLFCLISAGLAFILYKLLLLHARGKFLKDEAGLHSDKHQYRQIVPSDFPHLDIAFYDMSRDWLARRGFAFIADIEDFSIAFRRPAVRSFYRIMSGDGGGSLVRIFQLKPRNLWGSIEYQSVGVPAGERIVEFSTELENGTFIITSNAERIPGNPEVAKFVRNLLPEGATLDELIEKHRESVLETLMGRNTRTRALDSLNNVIESFHRSQSLLNEAYWARVAESRGEPVEALQTARSSGRGAARFGDEIDDVESGLDESLLETDAGTAVSIDPNTIEIALDDLGDDGGDMTVRWKHFCTALRRTIDSTGVPYEMLVAVTKHGSEIGIGRMRGEKPYLCFKRPDEAGELENFQPYYLEGASYAPPFSRIEAIVVGLDHNRVLYVLLEFLEEKEGEERFMISFDPDWDQPTILYLGADLDAGKTQPYDVRKR
jgi:hypothetical protein